MIRFAWLQAANHTLIGYLLLLAIAIASLVTGIQLSHLYSSLVAHCQSGCGLATQDYLSRFSFMDKTLDILSRAAPALLGLFWGAPLLAREYETGSYRLAWTQSVPRPRWLLVKVGVNALATVVLMGLFSLTVTWWYHGRDKVGSNIYQVFDRRDIAPIGYGLFAFAVGVMFGALIRRTVPAMAASLAAFIAVRVVVSLWIRPHLLPATHTVVGLDRQGPVQLGVGVSNGGPIRIFAQGGGPPNSWTQASHFITPSGQRVTSAQLSTFLHQHCSALADAGGGPIPIGKAGGPDPGAQCLDQVTSAFRLAVSYQPASHYWILQWLEAGGFALLGLLAVAATYWLVVRRGR